MILWFHKLIHYRPIDSLVSFSKIPGSSSGGNAPVRYAVRQVLDQEYRKETTRKQAESSAVYPLGKNIQSRDATKKIVKDEYSLKRDFFGRIIQIPSPNGKSGDEGGGEGAGHGSIDESSKAGRKIWVTFHEGFSNAVRKPISMGELLSGL